MFYLFSNRVTMAATHSSFTPWLHETDRQKHRPKSKPQANVHWAKSRVAEASDHQTWFTFPEYYMLEMRQINFRFKRERFQLKQWEPTGVWTSVLWRELREVWESCSGERHAEWQKARTSTFWCINCKGSQRFPEVRRVYLQYFGKFDWSRDSVRLHFTLRWTFYDKICKTHKT